MKTYTVLAALVALIFAATSTGFALEAASTAAPMNLAQFERAYLGTKPVVASMKFFEAKQLERYPLPTLTPVRIRMNEPRGETKAHVKPVMSLPTAPWYGPRPSLKTKLLL